ncbi:hypothetical protein MTO96_018806 [Rhipicephalus appendiculatus]
MRAIPHTPSLSQTGTRMHQPLPSLYASLPSLVSESLRWASLVSLAFGWTEVVHRPLPASSKGRSMTLMDGVFTLFNIGSSVTAIRQGVYMIKEKQNLMDICPPNHEDRRGQLRQLSSPGDAELRVGVAETSVDSPARPTSGPSWDSWPRQPSSTPWHRRSTCGPRT